MWVGGVMRLSIKQNDRVVREFEFTKGPVLIGRGENCQVRLPDKSVSKQHALLSSAPDGKWVVEDQGSTNKTYLNGTEIKKSRIENGDCLRITNFMIIVHFQNQANNNNTTDKQNSITIDKQNSDTIDERDNNTALKNNQRHSAKKSVREHKIVTKKPKANVNVFLAVFAGMMIGLLATLILKFMGGRFF